MTSEPIFAWHFLALDGNSHPTLRDGRPKPPNGRKLTEPNPILCERGLHASVDPLDALEYAPGPYLCRVKLTGEVIHGDDKMVASERTILYGFDASRVLRLFACWCVRNTPLEDGRTTWGLLTDSRSRAAVEVAERYALGQTTKEELGTARAAAWAAARAARAAARDAASAARGAARDAQSKQLSAMIEAEARRRSIFRHDK